MSSVRIVFIKSIWEWLNQHALRGGEDDSWRCKETGSRIKAVELVHNIWTRNSSVQSDRTIKVMHVACLACNPNIEKPTSELPIYEDEIVEVEVRIS